MTEQKMLTEIDLHLTWIANHAMPFKQTKKDVIDIIRDYSAAQVAAKDAENERLKAEIEGLAANLQGQVDARKRDLTSKRELNGINRSLRDENKRLREGIADLRDWGYPNEAHIQKCESLLSPKEDGKPIEPPAPDELPTKSTKKLYFIEAFDSDGAHVDSLYYVDWNRREAYFSVMNRLKPHSRWDATECDSNGNIIQSQPKKEDSK